MRVPNPERLAEQLLLKGEPIWVAELRRRAGIGYKRAKKVLESLRRRHGARLKRVGSAKVILL